MQEIRAGVQFGGDTAPSVSAIVVNHNRAGLLRDSLDSLLRQTLEPSEIIFERCLKIWFRRDLFKRFIFA